MLNMDWISDVCSSDLALIEPTRIYVAALLPLIRTGLIASVAHITGGGLLENIPRILPEGAHAVIDADAWEQPRLMAFLQAQGNIEQAEMARTFHCGVGMVLAVTPGNVAPLLARLADAGETAIAIGRIAAGEKRCHVRGAQATWRATAALEHTPNTERKSVG